MYEHVAEGGSHILLVGGYAGVGKTSIIQEIYCPVAEHGGFFASGKAEQLQINTLCSSTSYFCMDLFLELFISFIKRNSLFASNSLLLCKQ